MNEARSGLGWILNVVVILILLWVGWLVSDMSKRMGALEQKFETLESTMKDVVKPPPGPGPIITVEPDSSGGSVKTLWKYDSGSVTWGESGYINNAMIGTGVNTFTAKSLGGSVYSPLSVLTIKTKAHTIEIVRDGVFTWKVDGTPLQKCYKDSDPNTHECTGDGIPEEFDGELDSSIQGVIIEGGGTIPAVGWAKMRANVESQ